MTDKTTRLPTQADTIRSRLVQRIVELTDDLRTATDDIKWASDMGRRFEAMELLERIVEHVKEE